MGDFEIRGFEMKDFEMINDACLTFANSVSSEMLAYVVKQSCHASKSVTGLFAPGNLWCISCNNH